MGKMFSILLLVIVSIALAACNRGPSDSEKIEKMKSIVKGMLIDGESAQFSDLKYYQSTNFGCGVVNAKNKFGGYVGKKTFVVSLDQNAADIDPERETPEAPKAPGYVSAESAIGYASASQKWISEVEAIRNKYMAFDAIVAAKCTDTPPKEEKKEVEKKDSTENKIQFVPYEEKDGFIAQYSGAYPVYSVNLSKTLGSNLKMILKPKGLTETTAEFAKRSNYRAFDTGSVDINRDYGLVLLDNLSFDDAAIGVAIKYDADKEKVSIHSQYELCDDPARATFSDIARGKEYGISCNFHKYSNIIQIVVSSKQSDFIKYFKREDVFTDRLHLNDSFKLSRLKLSELPTSSYSKDSFRVGVIIVGRINKNLTISNFSSMTGNFNPDSMPNLPFTVGKIVYYNSKTGEILASRVIK